MSLATAPLPGLAGRHLRCNGVDLTLGPDQVGWLRESHDVLDDVAAQRARLDAEGYLFFRGALPREQVLDVRRRVLEVYREALAPGTDPVDGIAAEPVPPGVFTQERALRANRLWSYAALCYSPAVVRLHEALLGGLIHLHRRKIIRLLLPGGRVGDVHQDICYLEQGTPAVMTSWIPLGDMELEVGGLMLLSGSHTHGHLPHCKGMAGPAEVQAELGGVWRTADYRAGDMIIFRSTLVHTGLDNVDLAQRRIRLSSDTRYQLASDVIDERWQNEWHPLDGL